MKQILDFLRAVPAFYVATADEAAQPRVRPFSLVYQWEGKLSFGTSDAKPIYRQLSQNPFVEICAFNPESGEWMRIAGRVRLFKSVEANRHILNDVMPSLKELYGDENNPSLVCFSLEEGEAKRYSFASLDPLETIEL
jgi:uncharacterized pyridoxamine 5'-phosphate oxidase family protein